MSVDGLKLSVYFGESDRVGHDLLSDVLIDRFASAGVPASALLRAVEGFGVKHRLRTDLRLSLSEDLPLLAVAVGDPAAITALAHDAERLLPCGLLTLERVGVADAERGRAAAVGGDDDPIKLTFYCGRRERRDGRPTVERVLTELRSAGAPGATALAGVDGTILGRRHRGRFFSRNAEVPALVLSVGPRRRLLRALPALRALSGADVVTIERVRIVRHDGRIRAELPAPSPRDAAGLRLWQRVTVVCGEDARWEGQPLHMGLIRRLREAGAAGATVLRGVSGYSGDGPVHGDRLFAIRRRTPVVITAIDGVEAMTRLWPIIARATATTGLVTVETVPAFRAAGPDLRVGGLRLARPGE